MPPDAPVADPPAAPPPESPKPATEFGEAFAALDALGHEKGTPDPPKPPPADNRARGTDGKFTKTPDKPVEKPTAKAPEPDDDVDVNKLPTRDVVKRYHALKDKEKAWLKEREELNKKISTPQEWPEKKTYEDRLAEREKAIEDHKKRVEEYERELQFTNFTKSQAYKDTYQKPYFDSWKAGQTRAASMTVIERKDDNEQVLQQSRKGTAADFDAIMSIPEDDLAAEKAAELFGPHKASLLLYHRERVREIQSKADAAVEEWTTKGVEREKVMREQHEKQSKHASDMVEHFQKAQIEAFPKWFKPDETDPKGNELLEFGQHLLNRVLKNGAPLKDGEKQMTDEQLAIAVAAVRTKAGAFDRINHRAVMLSKRVKELEKELAQYKSSTPGNGDGKGREKPTEEKTMNQKIWDLGREV